MNTHSFFQPAHDKLIQHKEGFYIQSAISADDYEKAMDIGIEAMNAEPNSECQIKLYYKAGYQYHFYFAINSLQEKFEEFSHASEAASGYSRLKQLFKWCLPNVNPITNDELVNCAIMFIKGLSQSYCFNGTPGFLGACSFYTRLAFFIGQLPKSSQLNFIESNLVISDLYKTAVELMFAAKLTKDYSKAEILNCDSEDEIKLFDNTEVSHQKILDFYNNYYCYYNKKHNLDILDIQTLKENSYSLAKIFFDNFIKVKTSTIANNSIFNKPDNETTQNVDSTKSSENQLAL